MVGITKLSELKTRIAGTLNRTDLTTDIPEFIALAHIDINARFRTADMMTSGAFTLTGGTPTVALPTRFKEFRRVQYTADASDIREIVPGPFSPLTQQEAAGQSGYPNRYSIDGDNMRVTPTPSATFTGTWFYFIGVEAFDFTDDDDTNWVLTDYPNVWLYGSLLSALPKIGNDVRSPIWRTFYEEGLNNIKADDRSKRFAKAPRMRSALLT